MSNIERIAKYKLDHPDAKPREISDALGISVSSVYARLGELRRGTDAARITDNDNTRKIDRDFGARNGIVTTRSSDIRTLDQALKAGAVDLTEWEVDRHVVNSWEVTMARKGTGTGKPETFTNFQVKVWLRRKRPAERSIENLLQRMRVRPARVKRPRIARRDRRKTLLELALYDAHFGMLAWAAETGENYDLKIARNRYVNAVDDLLEKSRGFGISRIVFPIGNDFFHLDNESAVTPRSHNQLDKDGRLCKTLEIGEEAVIYAVERCAEVAPVDVFWIPGNHDPLLSYNLCRVMSAYFRKTPHVNVNTSPESRKYIRFGTNLIGFTHGCDEDHNTFPSLMASECPDAFGAVTTREFHCGHFHKRKETHFLGVDSKHSLTVRILPSLASADAWHFQKGYVGGRRSADALLYDYETGFAGTFTSTAA